ncbi:MAG TPA: Hsp70 family protein [Verrucomicrobiota bacterium]|nr:Hsp70 family protein [Verrucomicrobiota bacterium]
MARIGIDFGTANTVIAIYNEQLQQAETLEVPGISMKMSHRVEASSPEQIVHIIPSVIHYGKDQILIGNQVLSQGLAEHQDTFRWMKQLIARRNNRFKKTSQGLKLAVDAGREFLTLLIKYISNRVSLTDDEFTFTAPTESFETFQDWLRSVAESAGIKRLRIIDEPTAAVLGYRTAAPRDELFLQYDHGCGTLNVAVVRLDLSTPSEKKAIHLGQAGRDGIGGMNIDCWIADDFCRRHRIEPELRKKIESLILFRAENTKISLSDPACKEVDMTIQIEEDGKYNTCKTTYTRSCEHCERGQVGGTGIPDRACLGCLLLANGFQKYVRETIERALENAAIKSGVRRQDISQALVTGGTSLMPCVNNILRDFFGERVQYQNPYDAVVRGACRGIVIPVLQHDYAIESWNREKQQYEFVPLFKTGDYYPTKPEEVVQLWARGSYDGMERIGLKIFEVSQMKRMKLSESILDEEGHLLEESRVVTNYVYVCLNSKNPTFIIANPPVNIKRDQKRFLCTFRVDEQRRLLVTVYDKLTDKLLMQDYPVVRL